MRRALRLRWLAVAPVVSIRDSETASVQVSDAPLASPPCVIDVGSGRGALYAVEASSS
jgi:hypothetical protein